jgi:glycine dehydrogenase
VNTNKLIRRHIGLDASDIESMLQTLQVSSVEELIQQTMPKDILLSEPLDLPEAMTEQEHLDSIYAMSTDMIW